MNNIILNLVHLLLYLIFQLLNLQTFFPLLLEFILVSEPLQFSVILTGQVVCGVVSVFIFGCFLLFPISLLLHLVQQLLLVLFSLLLSHLQSNILRSLRNLRKYTDDLGVFFKDSVNELSFLIRFHVFFDPFLLVFVLDLLTQVVPDTLLLLLVELFL
mmetsp:Transcript_23654/g.23362  ORF Transcript_23654/g.23362 Transcript_23654/m.23362 type:complete len:158 (-) Transcript_23654:276-749(-)